jgi:hypothetical protein
VAERHPPTPTALCGFSQETAAIPASVPQMRSRTTGLIVTPSDWRDDAVAPCDCVVEVPNR